MRFINKKEVCCWAVSLLFMVGCQTSQKKNMVASEIVSGEIWNDTDGNPINAHGGGILYHEGTYYWYGEYKIVRLYCLNGLHGNVSVPMCLG